MSKESIEHGLRCMAALEDLWAHGRAPALKTCLGVGEPCGAPALGGTPAVPPVDMEVLSRGGEVYVFRPNSQRLWRVRNPEISGRTGYCRAHEHQLFDELVVADPHSFDPGSRRHLLLLSLRAWSRSYWNALNDVEIRQEIQRLRPAMDAEDFQRMLGWSREKAERGAALVESKRQGDSGALERPGGRLERLHASLRAEALDPTTANWRTLVLRFDCAPSVSASSMIELEFDMTGAQVNELAEFCLTVIPRARHTWLVFAYHHHYSVLDRLFAQISLAPERRMRQWLSMRILRDCENVALSPDYVESRPHRELAEIDCLHQKLLGEEIIPTLDLFSPS